MPLRLIEAEEEHRPILERLIQLFLHDVSEYSGLEPDDDGCYRLTSANDATIEEPKRPLLFLLRGKPAGFALIQNVADKHGNDHWWIQEFFVIRGYRRLGIGEEVARMVFDRFHGQWHVNVAEQNDLGIAFWRQVLRRYTLRKYREIRVAGYKGIVFEFASPAPDPIPKS